MRGPILAQFDQHLVRRHFRDRRGNRLVREAIDAGPEGTLRTGTADRIVDPLLVRAPDDPVVAQCVLDSLTAQPVRQFGAITGSFLTSPASVLHVRIGFASFWPARRRMPTTSFVACPLSGPQAEIVASGYLAREGWEARIRFNIRRASGGPVTSAAACAFFEAESRVARRTRPGESDHRW